MPRSMKLALIAGCAYVGLMIELTAFALVGQFQTLHQSEAQAFCGVVIFFGGWIVAKLDR